jgi:hypothetical protein
MPATKARRRHLAASLPSSLTTHAPARPGLHAHAVFDGRAGIVGGPIVPRWTDEKPAWIGEPLLSYLKGIDLGHELRELSAEEWLAGCNISFDRVSLIAAGGFPTRLGRMGSGSTLLSNEELEASERVRAMGKLAIYTSKAVVEHVIPPERLTPSWFRRRAAWQAVSDLLSEPELAPDLAAIALQRLSQRSDGGPLFDSLRSGAALKQDMDIRAAHLLAEVTYPGLGGSVPLARPRSSSPKLWAPTGGARRSSASTPTRSSGPSATTRPRSPCCAESAWFELPLSTAEKTVSAPENHPLGAE